MSLKAFHVVFVAASVALCLLMAFWGFDQYRQGAGSGALVWCAMGGLGAVTLLAYGRYFLRKLRHISYL